MATFEIEYYSEVLDMARHVSVIYPDAAELAACSSPSSALS